MSRNRRYNRHLNTRNSGYSKFRYNSNNSKRRARRTTQQSVPDILRFLNDNNKVLRNNLNELDVLKKKVKYWL